MTASRIVTDAPSEESTERPRQTSFRFPRLIRGPLPCQTWDGSGFSSSRPRLRRSLRRPRRPSMAVRLAIGALEPHGPEGAASRFEPWAAGIGISTAPSSRQGWAGEGTLGHRHQIPGCAPRGGAAALVEFDGISVLALGGFSDPRNRKRPFFGINCGYGPQLMREKVTSPSVRPGGGRAGRLRASPARERTTRPTGRGAAARPESTRSFRRCRDRSVFPCPTPG